MYFKSYAFAAAAAVVSATPAAAVTIVTPSGITQQALTSGTNFNTNTSFNGKVYLFSEGTRVIANVAYTTYLLHYQRGGLLSGDPEVNSGGFGIQLGTNEALQAVYTTYAALQLSDPNNNSVNYSNDIVRGLEPESALFFGDTLVVGASNPINVTFRLDTARNSLDEARFVIARAVPEPATWAMMIAGFALMGAVLRRRLTGLAGTLA